MSINRAMDETKFDQLSDEVYGRATELLQQPNGENKRNILRRELLHRVKQELGIDDWPTINEQDPFGYAIWQILEERGYGNPRFNVYPKMISHEKALGIDG